jgi:hypothetical protein
VKRKIVTNRRRFNTEMHKLLTIHKPYSKEINQLFNGFAVCMPNQFETRRE